MRSLTTLLMALAMVLPAACHGDRSDAGVTAPDTPAATPAAAPAPDKPVATPAAAPAADHPEGATARYSCDAGVTISILHDETARVVLPNQPEVTLGRVANSTPPVYTGANLYLTVGNGDAHLSQEDGTELGCRAQ